MFWNRKKSVNSGEVEEAKDERDEILAEGLDAVKRVDRLQRDLLSEAYEQANGSEDRG